MKSPTGQLSSEERATILARDGHACRHCGKQGARLDVHHIQPRLFGGTREPSNLITLCRKCHKHAERESRSAWATACEPMSGPPRKIAAQLVLDTNIRAALENEAASRAEDMSAIARAILRQYFGLDRRATPPPTS